MLPIAVREALAPSLRWTSVPWTGFSAGAQAARRKEGKKGRRAAEQRGFTEAGDPGHAGDLMVPQTREPATLSRFLTFSRDEWAERRNNTPLTLSDADLAALRGLNDVLSMDEVVDIYLPLSRLLSLHVRGTRELHRVTYTFLDNNTAHVPFVIGLAGSVAVGKSTTSRILQALLARWPDHPAVDLVTTDGFLFPNAVLEERGLMHRKGFPESYDRARLVRCLAGGASA
jgi:hypothetical protein